MGDPKPNHTAVHSSPSTSPQGLEERLGRLNKPVPFALTPRDQALFDWLDLHLQLSLCGIAMTPVEPELSRACQVYYQLSVRKRGGLRQLPMPVLYLNAELPGREKSIFLDILKALDHDFMFGPLQDLRERTWGTLKSYGVKLLIIDHADILRYRGLHELGRIFQACGVAIILLGAPQLSNRVKRSPFGHVPILFHETHEFRRLDIDECLSIIEHWEENILTWRSDFLIAKNHEICVHMAENSHYSVDAIYGKLQKIAAFCIENDIQSVSKDDIDKILGYKSFKASSYSKK